MLSFHSRVFPQCRITGYKLRADKPTNSWTAGTGLFAVFWVGVLWSNRGRMWGLDSCTFLFCISWFFLWHQFPVSFFILWWGNMQRVKVRHSDFVPAKGEPPAITLWPLFSLTKPESAFQKGQDVQWAKFRCAKPVESWVQRVEAGTTNCWIRI